MITPKNEGLQISPQIVGQQPEIVNQICKHIFIQEYYYQNNLKEEVSAAFFLVDDSWYRLTIDSGVIFWRSKTEAPEPFSMPGIDGECKIIDLNKQVSINDKRIQKIESIYRKENEFDAMVRISLDGTILEFINKNDVTKLRIRNESNEKF